MSVGASQLRNEFSLYPALNGWRRRFAGQKIRSAANESRECTRPNLRSYGFFHNERAHLCMRLSHSATIGVWAERRLIILAIFSWRPENLIKLKKCLSVPSTL